MKHGEKDESAIDTPKPESGADSESSFRTNLTKLLNCHSRENGSDTPDFILADFLAECLRTFDRTTRRRTNWYTPAKAEESPAVREALVENKK